MTFVAVAFCRWCRETRALSHDCQGLECAGRRPDGERCGLCPNDLRLQGSDPRYGSPSDLDHPWPLSGAARSHRGRAAPPLSTHQGDP